ncbi:hypothetical protein CR105_18590 [Massilia eurypsychrophila]|uniref:Peptidase M20 dimerisation domain-containing protein n=2 Tax=Massilia eurypsychrophila TaxID=1485217 RepID=A0A2G8TBT2_9BURK|nr:hypothetical protein CR105_18590 [Massilia eurypsychrophila]
MRPRSFHMVALVMGLLSPAAFAAAPASQIPPSTAATKAATHALKTYSGDIVASVAKMVSYNTVAVPNVPIAANPAHIGFKQYLREHGEHLGFDVTDYGSVVVVGMGKGPQRVGIVTHGDVQPVNPAKWAKSPFELDTTSEPGRLIGRGTEDDKGPIATALYAMKAIKDQGIVLSKRIELYVYMAEESDWDPLVAHLKEHAPPQMNITLDSEYPVVTAEKGFGSVSFMLPNQPARIDSVEPDLIAFTGGFFGSQIPEDAGAVIANATPRLEAQIRQRAAAQKGMRYQFLWQDKQLAITALGVSAHSSQPENGVNAISMLADALAVRPWADSTAGALVNFLNEVIGTGVYGQKFGNVAYRDDFMGPMTVAPTVIKQSPEGISLNINIRRPKGKSKDQVVAEMSAALTQWQARHVALTNIKLNIGDPWVQANAPQVDTLLSVFSHYTGIKNAKPRSIGGGTNSRLFPNAVSFGPAMPDATYSGHSEHEFITLKQLLLNLQMYTAVLVELAK